MVPSKLSVNDKVAVVAPAGVVDYHKCERGILKLEDWGLQVVRGKHLYGSYLTFSGTDYERYIDLKEALEDPDIKAVFTARGGYGTTRLLDKIADIKPSHSKWIIGYSDITALHQVCNQQWGWSSLLSPCVSSYNPTIEQSVESFNLLHDILFDNNLDYEFNCQTVIPTIISGEVVGGNLSLLYALRGTPYDLNPRGKILLIEDVGEYYYHLDRMLTNMKMSGWFDDLKALIIGDFNDMKNGASIFANSIQEIVQNKLPEVTYPIVYNFPSGHGLYNYPIVMGGKAEIIVGKPCSYRYQQ